MVQVTPAQVRERIERGAPSSECARELAEALRTNAEPFEDLDPGTMTAKLAAANFAIREQTSREHKIDTAGMEEAVAALRALPPDEEIGIFCYSGPRRLFTVFVRLDGEIIACIRVTERHRPQVWVDGVPH